MALHATGRPKRLGLGGDFLCPRPVRPVSVLWVWLKEGDESKRVLGRQVVPRTRYNHVPNFTAYQAVSGLTRRNAKCLPSMSKWFATNGQRKTNSPQLTPRLWLLQRIVGAG